MMDSGIEKRIECNAGAWHPGSETGVHGLPVQTPMQFSTWKNGIIGLLKEKKARKLICLLVLCTSCYCVLLMWCSSTQSMGLLAYTYTVGFCLLSLLICILTVWVQCQPPTPVFTFGYDRFEVLGVFGSTVLAQLATLFVIKESLERLVLEQPEVHIGRLLLGAGVAFTCHLLVLYGCNHAALDHVAAASASSWLQEHVSDMSQSICSLVPAFSRLLLPRVNPMLLVASVGGLSLVLTDVLIQFKGCHVVDTLAGIWVALTMWATMLPMSVYCGKVLMQTTPSHLVGQLDKCLRETLTIDGVLEFRNEHFWTLSFGKMAGCLQVRVRRDANEQMVLAHVVDRLSSVVSELTVQVFKDEWTLRRGVGGIGNAMGISPSFPSISSHTAFASNNSHHKSGYSLFTSDIPPSLPSVNSAGNVSCNTHSVQAQRDSYNGGLNCLLPVVSHSVITTTTTTSTTVPLTHFQVSKGFPVGDSFYQSPERADSTSNRRKHFSHSLKEQNDFLPNVLYTENKPSCKSYEDDLLISGTTSLDVESFTYRPQ